MQPPPLVLIELQFKTLAPINKLPFFHGPQWSALFRNISKPFLAENSLSKAGIWIHPIETGMTSYQKDETIHLGLTFPIHQLTAVSKILEAFNDSKISDGHFQPSVTISLERIICRLTGDSWSSRDCTALNETTIADEIEALSQLNQFSILFHSPLRLPRPQGYKEKGHHYCDEDFFIGDTKTANLAIKHLLQGIRAGSTKSDIHTEGLTIKGGALKWLDVSYGVDFKTTIGGVVGKLIVTGKPDLQTSESFVIGQYTGVGKNPTFGFGFYTIPEIDTAKKVRPLTRGKSFFQRVFCGQTLRESLYKLPNSSPGPDMLSVEDIKKAGDSLLEKLTQDLTDGTYTPGGLKRYRLQKEDGSFREIQVQNVTDRLIHRAVADALAEPIDRILSGSSYAYRRGLNRKGAVQSLKKALNEGYTLGIKADISAFFDSINRSKLFAMLEGLFPFEPMIPAIFKWINYQEPKDNGLPQGSPLSPLLSNLYLDRFDRQMTKEGFRLIRYADDFVVLFKEGTPSEDVCNKIEQSLNSLGLTLKKDKTLEIHKDMPISFLGYLITKSEISELQKDKGEKQWLPVFKEDWDIGSPLYLTSTCRGAYSTGPYIVVKTDEDTEERVSWSQISRIVIVGRPQFSGGVIYRAVKESIPVTFIDILGRLRGQLYSERYEMPEIVSLQVKASKDRRYCLNLAKEIISAKIHNSMVILRRKQIDTSPIKEILSKVKTAPDLDTLRGYEGSASRLYFAEFSKLVLPFEFKGRVYHPPEGPVNVLLSLGYSLLYHRISTALRDKGFNPKIGFFHKGRGMHCALASDLLEELRHIVERVVLSLINLGEIKEEDFKRVNTKGIEVCRLEGRGFRKYIHRFEVTMASKASYHGSEKLSYNAYIDEMVDKLKRSLKLGIPYKAMRID